MRLFLDAFAAWTFYFTDLFPSESRHLKSFILKIFDLKLFFYDCLLAFSLDFGGIQATLPFH